MAEQSNPLDKRRFSRVAMDGEVAFGCGASEWPAHLVDISFKGALISVPQEWQGSIGESCTLAIALGPGVTIVMEGEVAHIESARIGFRCLHLDIDSISHLKRLVELNLGDPALLEREMAELL